MNKQLYKLSILLATVTLAISSCEDIIDVDLRSVDPIVVIEANLRMGDVAEVKISTTKDFSSPNDYPPITNAVVTLEDGEGNTEQLEYQPATGFYTSRNIRGMERQTYRLTVVYEGMTYTAESFMPPVVEIGKLSLFQFFFSDFPHPMVHFRDPVGPENDYYRFIVYLNGEYLNMSERLFTAEFTDGDEIENIVLLRPRNDAEDVDDLVKPDDEITIEMQCIDEGTFIFFNTLSMVENSQANPTSNIAGGALGYFCAYSFSRAKIIAEWE